MKRVALLVLVLILFFGSKTYSQTVRDSLPLYDRINLVFNEYCATNGSPGTSAEIMIKGNHFWSGVNGISHDEIPIEVNSLFAIGSHTKTVIATIILQMYQEGLLNLQDSISKYLPTIPNVNPDITIHQLLSHTSGVR